MLASRVRATGELVPARWLDVGLVAGLLVLVAVEAAYGLALTAGGWVAVPRAEAR
jgi:hypothetical protein